MSFSVFLNAPSVDWIRFFIFFLGIILFIALAEKTRIWLKWPAEVTRKLVHVLTGLLVFFSPFFFQKPAPLLWMGIVFIVVNTMGIKSGKLKGMHDTARASYGTVFYPLSFFVLVLFCWNEYQAVLMLGMIILAISDAAAAIVGENLKAPHEYRLGRDKKSLEGSAVMAISAFLLVLFLLPVIDHVDGLSVDYSQAIGIAVATALISTALEAISSGGSDNLSTPLGAAFVIYFLLNQTATGQQQFYIGLVLAMGMAFVSYKLHFLNASGSVSTFILAALVFGIGGWIWTIPILLFFILSSLLSKMGKKTKHQFSLMFEKSSCRDAGQVMANGGIAGSMVIGSVLLPHPFWFLGYLSALAAVTADTWATELGVFSPVRPISIKTWKSVAPGTSGGITIAGTLAGLTGAFLIGISGVFLKQSFSLKTAGWIAMAGVLGSLVDSLLGATVQAQYQCPDCQKITERQLHCNGEITRQVSGLSWMNNDWVNALCAASGVFFIWIYTQF